MSRRSALAIALVLAAFPAHAQAPDLGTDAQRAAGKTLYDKFCAQCHGEAGDGKGVAAAHLTPVPRDFTSGKFKVRTTPSGALPTTDDLKHIIRRGMPYTTMPAWPQFEDGQLAELAYYVKSFYPDFAKAEFNVAPVSLPSSPKYKPENAEAGRKVYEQTGCIACHGDQGRGDGTSGPTLKDDAGHPLRPADFTQRWTFRGGPTREDIFRTMTTGFNGTPMPAFGEALSEEQRWAITDYIYSLGTGDEPGYATLVHAKYSDEPLDLSTGAAAFAKAPAARFPIVGQIMEPGRQFHPGVVSIQVQVMYDAENVAFLLRWHDMSAEKSGTNHPALKVPLTEEAATTAAPAETPAAADDPWGESAAAPAPAAATPAASDDPWGESEAAPAAGAVKSEFSDAVAIQMPVALPNGPRKPYFIFGDAAAPVDLWFVDLANGMARQYVGKGSADVTLSESDDVTATASYDKGEWSVIFKRPRVASSGIAIQPGEFVPVAFSVWDGLSRERGNRRGITQWFSLYVEPEKVVSPVGPMLQAGLGVFALEILVIALVRRRQRRS